VYSRRNLWQVLGRMRDKTPDRRSAEGHGSLSGMVESGDFRIELARRTVTLRGRELPLTSEEFDVLVFLAGHPQRLITPRTVLSTSGTAHQVRKAAFLRALITLREKLDAASGPGKHYLRTEPWVLYRFDPSSLPTT
jgi:two-component system, OmpR family, KDP operon response regulator KdpE